MLISLQHKYPFSVIVHAIHLPEYLIRIGWNDESYLYFWQRRIVLFVVAIGALFVYDVAAVRQHMAYVAYRCAGGGGDGSIGDIRVILAHVRRAGIRSLPAEQRRCARTVLSISIHNNSRRCIYVLGFVHMYSHL